MGVVSDLRELAAEEFQLVTVVATVGTYNEDRKFTASDTIAMKFCHIEIENKLIIDSNGAEVHSKGMVISLEDNGLFSGVLDDKEFLFTLPAPWPEPRTLVRSKNIVRYNDEDGEGHEEIWL